jgi:hypothetical protein
LVAFEWARDPTPVAETVSSTTSLLQTFFADRRSDKNDRSCLAPIMSLPA